MIDTKHYRRGGSWDNFFATSFHTYFYTRDFPAGRSELLGFRCVYAVNNKPTANLGDLQGGSWLNNHANNFRAHHRIRNLFTLSNSVRGFRCVYSLGNPNDR